MNEDNDSFAMKKYLKSNRSYLSKFINIRLKMYLNSGVITTTLILQSLFNDVPM